MLRNGITGDWIGTFLGHKGAVWAAAINSSASLIGTGSADYTSKIWDATSGECRHTFEHKRIVKTVDFSHDSRKLLTGGQEKLLRVYELLRTDAAPAVLEGHSQPIKTALWHGPDLVLSGGGDECIRIWDLRTGKEEKNIPTKAAVSGLEICGRTLTASAGRTVFFYSLDSFALEKAVDVGMEVSSASLHPSRTRFVVGGSADFWDHVYDFASGKEIETHKGHHGPVHIVRYSPDGELFASGSEDGTIRLIQNEPKAYGLWQLREEAPLPQVA
jgi:serine-threonine kinase receptor-associated protein